MNDKRHPFDNFDCQCDVCQKNKGRTLEQRIAHTKKWEEEKLKSPGWFIRAVVGDENYPFQVNFNTHGLQENYGHCDLQIICPVSPQITQGIFDFIVDRIKDGETLESGQTVEGIFGGLYVKLESAEEGDREVLRVILPDPEGSIDSWSMKKPYNKQYFDLVELEDSDDDEDEEADDLDNGHDWFTFRK